MTTIFDIAAWKANISEKSVLHTNKYVIWITANDKINRKYINSPITDDSVAAMAADHSYRCIGTTLPGMVLRTSDNNRMGLGVIEKMPMSGIYTDIDLTILCDKDGAAYRFWYTWLNYIFAAVGKNNETNGVVDRITIPAQPTKKHREYYTMQYKDNYAGTVSIIMYDTFGRPALQHNLYQAFPIAINDVPVSWNDQNNLVKLNIKMTFREWDLDEGRTLLEETPGAGRPNTPTPTDPRPIISK